MTDVLFYHLERQSLDQALPQLLEACRKRDWRAIVQAGSAERVAALDTLLWTYSDDSFLPHGCAPAAPEDQPVWLTMEAETPNEANVLFLVDGADRPEIEGFERCVFIFDGADDTAVAQAREKWTVLKSAGHAVTYYQQNSTGAWEKKA